MSDQSEDQRQENLEKAEEELLKPSAEIEQNILFGRIDDAVRLYAKQAGIDEDAARAVVERLEREL
ncbi:hypothetical protein HJD18_13220 [Thermoleophilia bacterium SCSIO 60948]|nr:hypothetical protein HJD18_13220 [Thermoleophilia bacterium SCSIO 60948]